ncbi:RNA polymerase sigma factor [Enterococcus sp. OL5]|uniref:RNA polymerase sigma factor n=1 Tax=Enterococcus sp. OL5 TaxID=2590214 RepID=UPI001126CA47|nr:sigma-70 family RNA polymerase sigma factor [Enterococcus sp. OL5]TPR56849.1 sigma-70 family RNA polymerase sigma factor [Enterococcus sp. OL5]
MDHSLDFQIVKMFDSFCKKVIRNEARNIKKRYARLREQQISFTELPESVLDSCQTFDISAENSEVFLAQGMKLIVANLELAEVINQLSESKQIIILLYYFAGFNDREIGEAIGMSIGGVWYQRKRAEEELKQRLGEKSYE